MALIALSRSFASMLNARLLCRVPLSGALRDVTAGDDAAIRLATAPT
jgi:hypothetical protein